MIKCYTIRHSESRNVFTSAEYNPPVSTLRTEGTKSQMLILNKRDQQKKNVLCNSRPIVYICSSLSLGQRNNSNTSYLSNNMFVFWEG